LTAPSAPVRRLCWIGAFAAAVAAFIALAPGHRGWFDVGVYYGTVRYWRHDGGVIYDYQRPGTPFGFTYPPFAAICMLPLGWLPWHAAIAVSVCVNAAASATILAWLVDPIARRRGWPRYSAYGLAACLFAPLEPVRDTVGFGQVNLLLAVLVLADLRLLGRGHRLAGVGIGLASAIKLTPAIFIGYLLLARRWKAAATATAVTTGATLIACVVMPVASRVYWTEAVWDTRRVGLVAGVSNQSLLGLLARVHLAGTGRLGWYVVGALVVLGVWAYRARRAAVAGDDLTGFALTGVAACLLGPITWVHHLIWLIVALALIAEAALGRRPPARRRWLIGVWTAYAVLCSGVIWLWLTPPGVPSPTGPLAAIGANAYVWVSIALLALLPVRTPDCALSGDHVPRHAQLTDELNNDPAPQPPGTIARVRAYHH
jgi:alpha-1,2-mannosyltransferase